MAQGTLMGIASDVSTSELGWSISPNDYGNCIAGWSAVGTDLCLTTDDVVATDADPVGEILPLVNETESILQVISGSRALRNNQSYDGPPDWQLDFNPAHPDYYVLPGTLFRNRAILTLAITYEIPYSNTTAQTILVAYDDSGNVVFRLAHEVDTRKWIVEGRDANGHTFSLLSAVAPDGQNQTLIMEIDYFHGTFKMSEKFTGEIFASTSIGTDSNSPAGEPSTSNLFGVKTELGAEPFVGKFFLLLIYDEALTVENQAILFGNINFYAHMEDG